MAWDVAVRYIPDLARAAITTVELTVLTLLLSTVVGIPLAIIRNSSLRVLSRLVAAFSWLMRALPALLLLFFVYYGLPRFGLVLPAFPTAVVGLALSASAYNLEIFRAGLNAVDRGQHEAARALGLGPWHAWTRILIPQAAVVVIPPYVSNATLILKGSSIASIITVTEVTATANSLIGATYRPFELLVAAAIVYIALNTILAIVQTLVERRLVPMN